MSASTAGGDRAVRRIEILTGLVVIAVIVAVLATTLGGGGRTAGTPLRASFARIDGLGVGSDVKIAGVTVGHVTGESVDARSYLATVSFTVRPDLKLPVDSSAAILSEGLLGGKYLSISPGGDTRQLAPDGLITATQSAIGLDALLGKFIDSVTGLMDAVKAAGRAGGGSAPPAAPAGGGLEP